MVCAGQVVVVVDPFGSGRFLVDELLLRGWPLVAMWSSAEAPETAGSSWDPSLFEKTLVHSGDVLGTARSLREGLKRPIAVVPGAASGCVLADALAEVLSLRGNSTALSHCRADKRLMHERLRECGLCACSTRPCDSTDPCLCRYSGQEEFPHETEYVVDSVSLDGQHLVTAIWVCQKAFIAGDFTYGRTTTVPFSCEAGSVQQILCEYVFQCLTALGVQNGASHCKVVYNETQGLCLLKMSPHMHGSVGPAVWAACAGREQGQAFLMADALVEGGMMFAWKLETIALGSPPYELANYSIILDLQCPEDGILARTVEEVAGVWLRSLSSFWMLRSDLKVGDRIYRARDLTTSPGYIVLIGPDPAIVEQEAAVIREAERNGQIYLFSTSTSSKTPTPPAISDDEGTWGKCSLFLHSVPRDPSPRMLALESQMANLMSSPNASPELVPKSCAEFVLEGALSLDI